MNKVGIGEFIVSGSVKPVKPNVVPAKPVGPIKISNVLADQVTLNWAPPKKDDGSPVTSYKVEKSEDKTTWLPVDTVKDTEYVAKDLKDGHIYYFRVAGMNKVGIGEFIVSGSVKPVKPNVVPAKPVGPIKISNVLADQVTLNWSPPKKDDGSPVTSYKVEKSEDKTTWLPVDTVKGTEYVAKDLKDGHIYYFRVAAMNKVGIGEFIVSGSVKPVKPNVVPAKPVGPIKISNVLADQVTLNWSPPKKDDGSPVTSYKVEKSEDKTTWLPVDTVKCTEYVAKDLKDGHIYYFRVAAMNKVGIGEFIVSGSVKPVKPNVVPAKPVGPIKISNVLADQVTLNWSPPKKDDGSPVTSYKVEKSEDKTTWLPVDTVKGTEYVAKDLKDGHIYYFRVAAMNKVGIGEFIVSGSVKPVKPNVVPAKPVGPIKISNVLADQVTLNWSPPKKDDGSPVTSYKVEKSEDKTTWLPVDTVKCTEYVAKDLKDGHIYYFRVAAMNKVGIGEFIVSGSVKPVKPNVVPAKPVGPIKISNVLADQVTLNWSPPKKDDGSPVTSYKVEKSEDKTTWLPVDTVKGTEYVAKDLKDGHIYYFRVAAMNKVGIGEFIVSGSVKPVKPNVVPAKPVGPIKISNVLADQVTLNWSPPKKDDGSPVTSYKVEKSEDKTTWLPVDTVKGTEYVAKDLKDGHIYYFRVAAMNKVGIGEFIVSGSVKPVKPNVVPAKPVGPIKISNVLADQVTLNWSPPKKDNGSPVTSYKVEKSEDKTTWLPVDTVKGTEYVAKDLKDGHIYYFRVAAMNKVGIGEFIVSGSVKPVKPNVVPAKPVGPIKISNVLADQVTLNWSPPKKDDGSPVTSYKVEKSEDKTTWLPVDTVKGTEYVAKDLKDGHIYYFRVAAMNKVGIGEFIVSGSVKPVKPNVVPAKPVGPIKISNVLADQVTLNWSPPKKDDGSPVTSYKVEKSEDKTTWLPVDTVKGTEYVAKDLKDGHIYYFRVAAMNKVGIGEFIVSGSVKPVKPNVVPAKPVGPIKISNVLADQVTLNWSPPKKDDGSPVTSYKVEKSEDKTTWLPVDTVKGTEYVAKDLKDGHIYYFRVAAMNKVGIGEFIVSGSVKPVKPNVVPAKPVGPIKISNVLGDQVTLNWSPPKKDDGSPVTSYKVEKSEDKTTWLPVDTIKGTEYVAKDLKDGQIYYFRVAAMNKIGIGEFIVSGSVKPVKPNVVPAKPVGPIKISNVLGDQVTLNWSPPKKDDGSPVTSYKVEKSEDKTTWLPVDTVKGTEYVAKDLKDGEIYYFRVAAMNAVGIGEFIVSGSVKPVKPNVVPAKPVGPIKISNVLADQVTLNWSPPKKDDGSPVTSYKVEKSEDKTTWLPVDTVKGTEYVAKDLKDGHIYYFRVAAMNKVGIGELIVSGSVKPVKPNVVPTKPVGPIKISNVLADQVTLNWSPPKKDDGPPVTSYKVEKSEDKTTWLPVDTIKGTEYVAKDLKDGQIYYFRVAAMNAVGIGEFIVSGSVKPVKPNVVPAKPVGPIKISNVLGDQVTLNWSPPKKDDGSPVTSYKVEKSEDKTTWLPVDTVKGTEYVAKDLKDGQIYYFRVAAMNKIGIGEFIVSWSVKPVKPNVVAAKPVGPIKISDVLGDQVTLNWSPPKKVDGSPVTSYKVEKSEDKTTWLSVDLVKGTEYVAKDLKDGQIYYFRVAAMNTVGIGEFIVSGSVKPVKPNVVPAKPVGPIKISNVHGDQVTLNWSPPKKDDGSPVTSYKVEKSEDKTTWLPVDTVKGTEYVAKDLKDGHIYYFRVAAMNKIGIGEFIVSGSVKPVKPNDVSKSDGRKKNMKECYVKLTRIDKEIIKVVPAKPVGPIKISNVLGDQVTLNWSPPKKDGGSPVTSYKVEKSEDKTTWLPVDTVKGTEYVAKDLKDGQIYYFRVAAMNTVGIGEFIVSGSVKPVKPNEVQCDFCDKWLQDDEYLCRHLSENHLEALKYLNRDTQSTNGKGKRKAYVLEDSSISENEDTYGGNDEGRKKTASDSEKRSSRKRWCKKNKYDLEDEDVLDDPYDEDYEVKGIEDSSSSENEDNYGESDEGIEDSSSSENEDNYGESNEGESDDFDDEDYVEKTRKRGRKKTGSDSEQGPSRKKRCEKKKHDLEDEDVVDDDFSEDYEVKGAGSKKAYQASSLRIPVKMTGVSLSGKGVDGHEDSKDTREKMGRPVISFTGETSVATRLKPHRPCPFCGQFKSKLSEHLLAKHGDEEAVKIAISLPKQERIKHFSKLRKEGIWKANVEVIKREESKSERSQTPIEFYRERQQSIIPPVFCSLCKGFISRSYFSKHRMVCTEAESTTVSGQAIDPTNMFTPKLSPRFLTDILSKFHNTEFGVICRKDPLIVAFGMQEFKNIEAKKGKRDEKRKSLMSDMRRIAHLLVEFRKRTNEEEKDIFKYANALDMFDRSNWPYLRESIEAVTVSESGSLKAGLKIGLGYLLKRVAKFLNGEFLVKKKDQEASEIRRFQEVLDFYWCVTFGDAEYKVTVERQKELRMPQRLPLEEDVCKLRDWLQKNISEKSNFVFVTSTEFTELRDLIVCRLTLFNARRGGEPSRLLLSEWQDAENEVWFDNNIAEEINDPIEQRLLCETKVAFQAGKRKLVPLIIPSNCWKGMRLLADPKVRQDAGIGAGNKFLFPTTGGSDHHVIGWGCVKKCCSNAGLKKDITATAMRHLVATVYASQDMSEHDRKVFYAHMGHSEKINEQVYQCPGALKEVVVVGKFLHALDNADKPKSNPVAGSSQKSYTVKDFLIPLVGQTICERAVKGQQQIKESEVETEVDELKKCDFLLDPDLQEACRHYFEDDAWLVAENTLDVLQGVLLRQRNSEDSIEEDIVDSGANEEVTSEKDSICRKNQLDSNRPSTPKMLKEISSGKISTGKRKSRKFTGKRKCHLWTPENIEKVEEYFDTYIEDTSTLDNKGRLPGVKEVQKFLEQNPLNKNIPLKERTDLIKRRIFNKRKLCREKVARRLKRVSMS